MSKLVKSAMVEAHVRQTAMGAVCSDVLPNREPKWGTHSARRGGAKRALDTMNLSGVDRVQIDFHFGWDEMSHAKLHPMQWMYAGIAPPSVRIGVTKYF